MGGLRVRRHRLRQPARYIHSTQLLILWISSSFLQLVLLPVLIAGQNIQAKAADERAEATYTDAAALADEARQIQAHLLVQDEATSKILATVSTGRESAPMAATA